MDLTIQVEKTLLNIRVAVVLKTSKGYVIETHKKGYYFCIGGRVKAGESSLQAAKRELQEETGLVVDNLVFISLVENFYPDPEVGTVQEICFVYKAEGDFNISSEYNLNEFTKEEIMDKDIRPSVIKKIITEESQGISHHIIN